jgi:S-adenosylmethionine hydrolase
VEASPLITLTSDFGLKDPFVGIMKGVMLGINPSARIIDITHGISRQNIQEAAFSIESSYKYFPHKTIHVVVVDPGVGSGRRPILVSAEGHYFIGPDNGIFSRIYYSGERPTVINITSKHYFLPQLSSTFHGRDIFAPVAAWLSKGINILRFGDPITDYILIPYTEPVVIQNASIEGEIIYIDGFGNLITNISSNSIDELTHDRDVVQISVKGLAAPFKTHYAEAGDKSLCCLVNSFGYLELFVNGGSAASDFNLQTGEKVKISMP